LTVSEVLRIALDVASAMSYLHCLQPQVVHRDLKPQNVLLDLQGRAKVGWLSADARRLPLLPAAAAAVRARPLPELLRML